MGQGMGLEFYSEQDVKAVEGFEENDMIWIGFQDNHAAA